MKNLTIFFRQTRVLGTVDPPPGYTVCPTVTFILCPCVTTESNRSDNAPTSDDASLLLVSDLTTEGTEDASEDDDNVASGTTRNMSRLQRTRTRTGTWSSSAGRPRCATRLWSAATQSPSATQSLAASCKETRRLAARTKGVGAGDAVVAEHGVVAGTVLVGRGVCAAAGGSVEATDVRATVVEAQLLYVAWVEQLASAQAGGLLEAEIVDLVLRVAQG